LSVKLKTFFRSQDLWDIIKEGFNIPEDNSTLIVAQKMKIKENKEKDSRDCFALQQAINDTIFPGIIDATSAQETWHTIQEEFKWSDKVRNVKIHLLRRKFELIRMKESKKIKTTILE